MTPAGLEPAIPDSVGRCLIHWATGPLMDVSCSGAIAEAVFFVKEGHATAAVAWEPMWTDVLRRG